MESEYVSVLEKLESMPHPYGPHPGISGQEVVAYFDKLQINTPEEYRTWLSICNGAFVDSQYLTGIDTADQLDISLIYDRYPQWGRGGFIPIAGDGMGNFYAIGTRGVNGPGYPIVFFDHEESMDRPAFIVSSSFRVFVHQFVEKERTRITSWPYDRATVIEIDPAIQGFFGLPKAYEA